MIRFILTLLCVLAVTASYAQTARDLDINEFKHLSDSLPGAIIIDLRTPDELKDGVIPNAIHIDFFSKDFEQKISNLDPAKPYFLYCASGGRSGQTFELMGNKGFREVYNLEGGFAAWKKGKLPVEQPKRK